MKHLFILVALAPFVALSQQQQCRVNEVYKSCGGCNQYCNEGPIACTADCSRPGCYCRDGYVRSFRGSVDICIPRSDCPASQSSGSSLTQNTGSAPQVQSSSLTQNTGEQYYYCSVNEVYKDCGGCDQYCNKAVFCTADCRPGCYCQEGYVRSFEGGVCIPLSACPVSPLADPPVVENTGEYYYCSVNEVYKDCGGCDQYCNKAVFCTADCRPGCYCQEGYVRSFEGGVCIPLSACPAPPPADPPVVENTGPVASKCSPNEEYKTCGTACPATCDIKNPVCTQQCVPGCFCKDGYVRETGKRYKCVKKDQCPS